MIDLSKINDILNATQGLAQAQAQVNASQAGQVGKAQQQAQSGTATQGAQTPEFSALFTQLGQVLNTANSPAAQPTEQQAALQRQAAMVSARVNALVANAGRLEGELNLSPTPDPVSVNELFQEFEEIMSQLGIDMSALQKQVQENKDQNAMNLEQKPTAMKAGEHVGDPSFNTTLTLQ